MREVCITAARTVTGFGFAPDSLWQGAMAGKSAVRPLQRFPTARYLTDKASWVNGLEPAPGSSLIYPLLEQLLDGFAEAPEDTPLFMASTKGCVDVMERLQSGLDADKTDVLMAQLLARVAAMTGITAKAVNINAACASSTIAIARAAAMIAAGRANTALVVCADLVSEFVFSGFSALQALSKEGCRPFDKNRSGLSLGEGGAALLLVSRDLARRDKLPVLGQVAGWGAANDATHITAPARDGCGLIASVQMALAKAAIEPSQIAAISAHGTATVYNDAMELTAFRVIFGERQLPMHSIKGAIGHTLGAAGGIEAALALQCLEQQILPPTYGLMEPEQGAEGLVSPHAQPFHGDYLLSTNSGFGGVNAALILRREAP